MTDCSGQALLFSDLGARTVVADFSAGLPSSDGGVLLLRQIDRGLGLPRHLAGCFQYRRDARFVDHSVEQWVAQRLHGLALGYEDLNDRNTRRLDPLLAVACEKADPTGQDRVNPAVRGVARPARRRSTGRNRPMRGAPALITRPMIRRRSRPACRPRGSPPTPRGRASRPPAGTRSATAREATWRTSSDNRSWIRGPTGFRPTIRAAINYGCGGARWPTCSWNGCAPWAWRAPNGPYCDYPG